MDPGENPGSENENHAWLSNPCKNGQKRNENPKCGSHEKTESVLDLPFHCRSQRNLWLILGGYLAFLCPSKNNTSSIKPESVVKNEHKHVSTLQDWVIKSGSGGFAYFKRSGIFPISLPGNNEEFFTRTQSIPLISRRHTGPSLLATISSPIYISV